MYQLVYRKVFILKIDVSIYIKNCKKTGVEFSKENVKTYVQILLWLRGVLLDLLASFSFLSKCLICLDE